MFSRPILSPITSVAGSVGATAGLGDLGADEDDDGVLTMDPMSTLVRVVA